MDVSAERLPELDADFFTTGAVTPVVNLRMSWQQWKRSHARMVSVSDCLSFERYVLISREEAISNSFASLGLMAAQIQSQIAGRPLPEDK